MGSTLLVIAVIGDLTGIFQLDKEHPHLLLAIHAIVALALLAAVMLLFQDLLLRVNATTFLFRSATGPEETKCIDELLCRCYEGKLYPPDGQIFPLLRKNRHCFKILEARSIWARWLRRDPAVGIVFLAPLTAKATHEFCSNPSFRGLDLRPSHLVAPGEKCTAIYIGFTGIEGIRTNPRSRKRMKYAEQLVREIRKTLLNPGKDSCFIFKEHPILINRPITMQGINAVIKGGFRNLFPFQLDVLPNSCSDLKGQLSYFDRDSLWLRVHKSSLVGPYEEREDYDHRGVADQIMSFARQLGTGLSCWKQAEAMLTDAAVLNANYFREFRPIEEEEAPHPRVVRKRRVTRPVNDLLQHDLPRNEPGTKPADEQHGATFGAHAFRAKRGE